MADAVAEFKKVTIKFDGAKHEFLLINLDLAYPENPTDENLKAALAQELDIEVEQLAEYVIDRYDETIHVRPAATYGMSYRITSKVKRLLCHLCS